MSSFADPTGLPSEASEYDGWRAPALAEKFGIPSVLLYRRVGSTLDVAHRRAPEVASGTLVLADEQTVGRGRHGRRWSSAPGMGIWLTLVERPTDLRALDVLSLRCGLYAAESLDGLADDAVRVKWPNDLYVHERKLAGVLIETRWRGTAPDWVAIGVGVNVVTPDLPTAAGLRQGVSRVDALARLVPALRRAAAATHHLGDDEIARWHRRDVAVNRIVTAPAEGRVCGVSARGELLVADPTGAVTPHRTGSLTFAEPLTCS